MEVLKLKQTDDCPDRPAIVRMFPSEPQRNGIEQSSPSRVTNAVHTQKNQFMFLICLEEILNKRSTTGVWQSLEHQKKN